MLILFQDFVRDQYLEYKPTDDTTIMFDPDKTSFWFSLGPRALIECNQKMVLLRVGGVSIQFIIVIKKIICINLHDPSIYNISSASLR